MEPIAALWSVLQEHPVVVVVSVGVIALIVALKVVPGLRAGSRTRDPKRAYSTDDRQQGFQRAGNQCEYDRWLFFRCTRTAQHGDHFYPWSKGGATSMRNFVAACARCNCSKGARIPSPFMRNRIQHRRRNYFPQNTPVDVGQWVGR